jgi:hypothetical protein
MMYNPTKPTKHSVVKLIKTTVEVLNPFIKDYPRLHPAWDYLLAHPEFATQIGDEIDAAVILFNSYRIDSEEVFFDIPLKSSVHLKGLIHDDLPAAPLLIKVILSHEQRDEVLRNIMERVNAFEFIETMQPISTCAAALLLGSYRSAILELFPYIEMGDGQVASALEEMIATMAIKGKKTLLFEVCKEWYADYTNEGFTQELSEAVERIAQATTVH